MSGRRRRNRLVEPWRSVHGAVWLVGIALLAWTGWWWPGILILVAVSMVVEGIAAAALSKPEPAGQPLPAQPSPTSAPPPEPPTYRIDMLPSNCPKCAGPIHGKDVAWTSPTTADCPYCGTSLPMRKP